MTSKLGLLPNGIYGELFMNSHRVGRPIMQLKLELLRDGLLRNFDWQCDHDRSITYSKRGRVWYCTECGQMFAVNNPDQPVMDTWDLIKEQEFTGKMGGLQPDYR